MAWFGISPITVRHGELKMKMKMKTETETTRERKIDGMKSRKKGLRIRSDPELIDNIRGEIVLLYSTSQSHTHTHTHTYRTVTSQQNRTPRCSVFCGQKLNK